MGYWWQYIRYFSYLAWNWNLRLACFVIWHEVKGERHYRSYTVGINDLRQSIPHPEWLHASIYQPVNFYTAERLMQQLRQEDLQGAFLDAGCGKGRMLAMAAAHGFRNIFGFDLSAEMYEEALQHAALISKQYPHTAIHLSQSNARHYTLPASVIVIFLFNPFDNTVMKTFIEQVLNSLQEYPRQLTVLYANPVCLDLWLEAGFTEDFHFRKMKYLEGSVLRYTPQ